MPKGIGYATSSVKRHKKKQKKRSDVQDLRMEHGRNMTPD